MRIFITGATGYAGPVALDCLTAAGHDVSALARSDVAARQIAARGAIAVRGSLEDADTLRAAARDADAVVHLAADMTGPRGDELDRQALDGLLLGAAESRARFVYMSTTLVYGDTGAEPATEDRPPAVDNVQPWKVEGERRVLTAAGIRPTVLRPGLMYGRGGSALIRGTLAAARETGVATYVERGDNRWSAVHVDDLADLCARVLHADRPPRLLNAVAGEPFVMREMVEAVAELAGARAASIPLAQAARTFGPFAVQLTRESVADGSLAARTLDWRPDRPGLVEDVRDASDALAL